MNVVLSVLSKNIRCAKWMAVTRLHDMKRVTFFEKFGQALRYIISGSTFAAKQVTLLYSGALRGETVQVHGLHPTLTYGSKKSHGYCVGYTLANGINLLCEGSQKGFPT